MDKATNNSGSGSFGLMFHHFVGGDKHPSAQGAISLEDFEKIIDRFISDFKVLRAEEWAYKAESNKLKKGEVCVTFDDGLMCQVDVALPVLKSRGLTAFWFVQSGVLVGDVGVLEVFRRFRYEYFTSVEDFYLSFFSLVFGLESEKIIHQIAKNIPNEYLRGFKFYSEGDRVFRYVRDEILGPQQYIDAMESLIHSMKTNVEKLSQNLFLDKASVKELDSEGHIFGLHSHSHPTCLAGLPEKDQRYEYEKNYEILSEILRIPPFTMAHPCNSYNTDTLNILSSLGIRIGFCSNMHKKSYSNLEFPREDSANLLSNYCIASI